MKSRIVSLERKEIKDFLVSDAYESLYRAMSRIELPTEQELLEYDKIMEKAKSEGVQPLVMAYLDKAKLNTPMVAFYGCNFLYHFRDYVDAKIDIEYFFNLLYAIWTFRDHKHSVLLKTVLDAVELLFRFALSEDMGKEQLIKTGNSLLSISIELEKEEAFEEALANLHTAASFTQFGEPINAVDICRRIVEVARKAGHNDLTPNFLQLAALLSQLSLKDETKRIEAFDAMEALLRYILAKKQNENFEFDKTDLKKIEELLQKNVYLTPLAPLFYFGLEFAELPTGLPDISSLYTSVSNDSIADWVTNVTANSLIIDVANKRFELLPKTKNIEVFWSNWSIEYRRMLHSVPHNQSLLREEFCNEILMDLKHELIHVYSLFGSVGTTLNIMRWLLVDLEILLFINHFKLTDESLSRDSTLVDSLLQSRLPVQLTKPDPISLSYAERSVAIESKVRFIEHIWMPWFEGIAVFGETVDDPELDNDLESLPSSVIKNLVEIKLSQKAKEPKGYSELVAEQIKKMEDLYTEALKTDGVYRLRTYLTKYHKKYLPGYLCVRSILSKWRKTYKKPIRGDQAFRLFLHATRFSRFDVLPDLSLPIEEFKKEALDIHLAWIRSFADIDEATLDHFFNLDSKHAQQFSSWSNGKFFLHGNDWSSEQEQEYSVNKASECLSSLTGEKAYPERIPGASPFLREIAHTIAKLTGEWTTKPSVLNEQTSKFVLSRYAILPIAKSYCPFWLLSQGPRLCCSIRTREKDKDHGNPSYNLVSFGISQEDFDFLKLRIIETGIQYLTVTRAVFLGGNEDETLPYRHFLVYQYEDWMHFESMGLFWQNEVSEKTQGYLRNRFRSNPLMNYREALNGINKPCASRTKQWILQNEWDNVEIEDEVMDLEAWANYVLTICNEVLDDKDISDITKISYELLKVVLKDERQAELLSEQGLGFIEECDPLYMDKFINFLFLSARLPEKENRTLAELNRVITESLGPIMQKTSDTFDIVSI